MLKLISGDELDRAFSDQIGVSLIAYPEYCRLVVTMAIIDVLRIGK